MKDYCQWRPTGVPWKDKKPREMILLVGQGPI